MCVCGHKGCVCVVIRGVCVRVCVCACVRSAQPCWLRVENSKPLTDRQSPGHHGRGWMRSEVSDLHLYAGAPHLKHNTQSCSS